MTKTSPVKLCLGGAEKCQLVQQPRRVKGLISVLGHSRPGRASSKPGHVRYTRSEFRAAAARRLSSAPSQGACAALSCAANKVDGENHEHDGGQAGRDAVGAGADFGCRRGT